MTKKIITTQHLIDDLDGSTAHRTVTFTVDGTNYEIELSNRNATAFDKAIKPYVDAARKVHGAGRSTARKSATTEGRRADLADVRAWGRRNGFVVPDRGRIPNAVIAAYDAKH